MKDVSYKVFAGRNYESVGGYDDFVGACSSLEEACNLIDTLKFEQWAHIVFEDKIIEALNRSLPGGWKKVGR